MQIHEDSVIPSTVSTIKPSKYGRKKLLPELRRSYQFKVGYTEDEYHKLRSMSEKSGLAEAQLIRKLSLSQEIKTVSILNRTAYSELAKLASNLNQLSRVANASGIIENAELINKTFEAVQSLRVELLGQ